MPGIYSVDARFWVPIEGALALLQQAYNASCAGCPISVGGEPPDPVLMLGFYQSPTEITDATIFGDLAVELTDVVELNAEAGPGYCDGHLEGPVIDFETGLPCIILDQHAVTTTVAGQAFGAVIYTDFGDGDVILGVSAFPVPIGSGEVGDIYKVSGKLILCPCVPATEV